MFCPKCGTRLADNCEYCKKCGWESKKSADESVSDMDIRPKTILIACFVCLALIVSIIAGLLIYMNSDSVRIEKASKLIAGGHYVQGVEVINDVYMPQAVAIKNFAEVEEAKQAFGKIFNTGSYSDKLKAYENFRTTLTEFCQKNDVQYLPDNLRENYDCYKTACDYIDEFTGYYNDLPNVLVDALWDVQYVMLNQVDMNKSAESQGYFTLSDLQWRVDMSSQALEVLREYDFSKLAIDDPDVKQYCHISVDSEGKAYIALSEYDSEDMISDLMSYCKWEIEYSQSAIDELAEDHEMDTKLYRAKNAEEDYSSYVGDALNRIQEDADIGENVGIILETLRMDMLFRLLGIES